jgi:TPR repeat protein
VCRGGVYSGERRSLGVPQDDTEAVKWYRKAAEQGHAVAQSYLGVMYAKGQGVPRDYVQAYKWFTLAAIKGNAQSVKNRDKVASMMTPAQIAAAQKLEREWTGAHPEK